MALVRIAVRSRPHALAQRRADVERGDLEARLLGACRTRSRRTPSCSRRARSSCSIERPTSSWARSLRCLASSTGVWIAASAADTRSRRPRASASASWTGVRVGHRQALPGERARSPRGARRRCRSRDATTAGSSRIRRTVPPSVTKRPGASWTPTVSLMMSSRTWASSNTTTSCGGQDDAAAADVQPVEVGVDDDDVGDGGPGPGRPRRSRRRRAGSARLPGHSSLPTLTARHAVSDGAQSSSAASPVSVVADPRGDPRQLVAGSSPPCPRARAGRRRSACISRSRCRQT